MKPVTRILYRCDLQSQYSHHTEARAAMQKSQSVAARLRDRFRRAAGQPVTEATVRLKAMCGP
jgi:hypothetical protein